MIEIKHIVDLQKMIKNFLVLMPDASNQAEIEELLHLSAVLFFWHEYINHSG